VNKRKLGGKWPPYELEYTTFGPDALRPANVTANGTTEEAARTFDYPIPSARLPRSLRANGTIGGRSRRTPYVMKDLTVGSWLTLARKLGDAQKEKLRKRFRNYMTVGEDAEVET
jgi:endopolyphosphatase